MTLQMIVPAKLECSRCQGEIPTTDIDYKGDYTVQFPIGQKQEEMTMGITFNSSSPKYCRKCLAESIMGCNQDEILIKVSRFEEAWNGQ